MGNSAAVGGAPDQAGQRGRSRHVAALRVAGERADPAPCLGRHPGRPNFTTVLQQSRKPLLRWPRPERCPSGRRNATGNRVPAERWVEGSNPSLSVSLSFFLSFSLSGRASLLSETPCE